MEERKPDGTFAKGWGGGPGRPRRDTEEKYLRAFRLAVKAGDWRDIIEKARDQAVAGDKDARRFLADYLIGKPTQYFEGGLQVGGLTFTNEQAHAAKKELEGWDKELGAQPPRKEPRDGEPGGD